MQYGRTLVQNETTKRQSFFQAGIGAGVNFVFPQGINNSRLMLDLMLRYNYELIKRQQINIVNSKLSVLGTSIGLHFVFPVHPAPIININPDSTSMRVKTLHLIKATLPLMLGYSYEIAIGRKSVLNFEIMAKGVTGLLADEKYFVPGIKVEPRFYYGYERRLKRGQIVINNSSDFLAAELSYHWLFKINPDPKDKYWQISLVPKWGLRRAIGKRVIFEGAIGSALYTNIDNVIKVAPHIETRIGFAF